MRPQITELLPLGDLPAGARVLDLGCGSGTVGYRRFPVLRFFGLDRFAHVDTTDWPENARLTLADAQELPFAGGCFDAVVCNFVFEHFRDPRQAVRELDRVVRLGGCLYVSIPRSNSIEDILFRFTFKGGGHVQKYTLESFLGMIYEESGFKLEALGPAPAGFTWLLDAPFSGFMLHLLYWSFRLWRWASGRNPLACGSYLLLFRLANRAGFKRICQVCSHCGNSFSQAEWMGVKQTHASRGVWKCPACSFENILVDG